MNDPLESVEVANTPPSLLLNEVLLADIWRAFAIYGSDSIVVVDCIDFSV